MLQRYDYDSFGNVTVLDSEGDILRGVEGTPLASTLFQGRELDLESGLYYYRARFYSPELGRFISHDPKLYIDSMNLYESFKNNPLMFTDPMGTIALVDDTFIIGGAIVGAAILSDDNTREKGAELLSDAANWVKGSCENIGRKIGEAIHGAPEKEVEKETSKSSEAEKQQKQEDKNKVLKELAGGSSGTRNPQPDDFNNEEKNNKKESSKEVKEQTEKEADNISNELNTEKRIGFHSTRSEISTLIAKNGFKEGTAPGRLGSHGTYVNNTIEGAKAEFKAHNPGEIPTTFKVEYKPGVEAKTNIPPKSYSDSLPLNVDSISAPSTRAPGTYNTNILNKSIKILEKIQ